jgi:sporulation protein YlmC with PRC-barrel domain
MQRSDAWLATTLVNGRVLNSAGEDLGKVEDVVIDAAGVAQYAIISFVGVVGGNKLFAVPWSLVSIPQSRNYILLDIDREMLDRAPAFDRHSWPDMADPIWRRTIDDFYRGFRPVVHERKVYVDQPVRNRKGLSPLAALLLMCLVIGAVWIGFLVSSRGWFQAKEDIKSSIQGAAYAAKETSLDAALTTRVKTALSLSKRIPSDRINVDSEGDVVTLRGDVPSDQIRELAETIAADVPGVREVHNHLFAPGRSGDPGRSGE